jgi:YfiR/HmsC-like
VLLAPLPDLAGQTVTQPALKAAFLYNFAKFAEWPGDQESAGAITLCVLDDSAVDDALDQLSRGGAINGRQVTMLRGSRERLRQCHLLYVGGSDVHRALAILDEIKGAPVLTVSDGEQFPRMGGMIGLFLEDGKMRFAVNPDAAQRGGIRLSSRLMTLAKLVKDLRYAQP